MNARMERCQVTDELRNFEHAQSLPVIRPIGETEAKRQRVIELARDFVQGLPATILRWGRKYTRDDLMTDVFEHDLYEHAFFAAFAGDPLPLKDLMIRCAQYAAAEYLYDCEDLGFAR